MGLLENAGVRERHGRARRRSSWSDAVPRSRRQARRAGGPRRTTQRASRTSDGRARGGGGTGAGRDGATASRSQARATSSGRSSDRGRQREQGPQAALAHGEPEPDQRGGEQVDGHHRRVRGDLGEHGADRERRLRPGCRGPTVASYCRAASRPAARPRWAGRGRRCGHSGRRRVSSPRWPAVTVRSDVHGGLAGHQHQHDPPHRGRPGQQGHAEGRRRPRAARASRAGTGSSPSADTWPTTPGKKATNARGSARPQSRAARRCPVHGRRFVPRFVRNVGRRGVRHADGALSPRRPGRPRHGPAGCSAGSR